MDQKEREREKGGGGGVGEVLSTNMVLFNGKRLKKSLLPSSEAEPMDHGQSGSAQETLPTWPKHLKYKFKNREPPSRLAQKLTSLSLTLSLSPSLCLLSRFASVILIVHHTPFLVHRMLNNQIQNLNASVYH